MINHSGDIKTRTFGIEIEMCNLERSKVSLPSGYKWSSEEEIVNTDGSSNKQFGGEVNTPALAEVLSHRPPIPMCISMPEI